jgi:hypothetical protein
MAAMCQNWEMRLAQNALMLYKAIWTNRNSVLHGKSWKESKEKLQEWVIDAVTNIYKHPPKLHPRFKKIRSVPLEKRLRNNTASLQQWLARIAHQRKISDSLFSKIMQLN